MGLATSRPNDTEGPAEAKTPPCGAEEDTSKRRLECSDADGPAEELENASEKRRKLEDFGWSGDESSEFVSADEEGGVAITVEGQNPDASEALDELEIAAAPLEDKRHSRILIDADEPVARIMKGYTYTPISQKPRQQQSRDDEIEEEREDDDDAANAELGEDTQVVQNSMDVDGMGSPLVGSDSGHDSIEDSMAESSALEQDAETAPESAGGSPLIASQDRMRDGEEMARQTQAERGAGAGMNEVVGSPATSKAALSPGFTQSVPDCDGDEARRLYVAERKARKKERLALARQQRKTLNGSRTIVVPAMAMKKSVCRILPAMPKRTGRTCKAKRCTRSEKRKAKRARRFEEMRRAARNDPAPYLQMLQAQAMAEPELPSNAAKDGQREHYLAARRQRRARARLQQFEAMVASFS